MKSQNDKVQAQLSKFQVLKENDVQIWKVKYENILHEKEKLEKLLQTQSTNDDHQELIQLKYKTYQLEHENKELRQKLNLPENEMNVQKHHNEDSPSVKVIEKNFGEQIAVSEDHYKIPIAIRNKLVMEIR